MNSEKVGKFIKEIRTKNNLTQKQFADKYGVTYQAVSKWENGINLPDVALIKQISKDFNISIDDIFEGKVTNNNNNNRNLFLAFGLIIIIMILLIVVVLKTIHYSQFEFKTLSTTCDKFKVSGSIAYDSNKSSIYISRIDYCGGDDNTSYKKIECNLYEKNKDTVTKISGCKSNTNITLEEYLKEIELSIDNYAKTCKNYTNDSLYLEVSATDDNDKVTTYNIPLSLNENCSK